MATYITQARKTYHDYQPYVDAVAKGVAIGLCQWIILNAALRIAQKPLNLTFPNNATKIPAILSQLFTLTNCVFSSVLPLLTIYSNKHSLPESLNENEMGDNIDRCFSYILPKQIRPESTDSSPSSIAQIIATIINESFYKPIVSMAPMLRNKVIYPLFDHTKYPKKDIEKVKFISQTSSVAKQIFGNMLIFVAISVIPFFGMKIKRSQIPKAFFGFAASQLFIKVLHSSTAVVLNQFAFEKKEQYEVEISCKDIVSGETKTTTQKKDSNITIIANNISIIVAVITLTAAVILQKKYSKA